MGRNLQITDFQIADWVAEGPAILSASSEGALIIDSLAGGSTVWYKPITWQGNMEIAWRIGAVEPLGKNNLNFIFHATEVDGSDVLSRSGERTGAYGEYHKFPNYIITFVGPAPGEGYTRLRRNPGFQLLSENIEKRAEVGREYEMSVLFKDGRIQASIDGDQVHDYLDPKPLFAGRLGIRTWETKLIVSKLVVCEGDS